jgi:hypothetical protein
MVVGCGSNGNVLTAHIINYIIWSLLIKQNSRY